MVIRRLEEVLHKAPEMALFKFSGTNWSLLLCLTLAWIAVFLCVSKGSTAGGTVLYITALLPYFGLCILFFRGVSLSGAGKAVFSVPWCLYSGEGITYFLAPRWDKLWDPHVWAVAGSQIFYSLGQTNFIDHHYLQASGGAHLLILLHLILIGIMWDSNPFSTDFSRQFFHDTYIVLLTNYFTSIFAGKAIVGSQHLRHPCCGRCCGLRCCRLHVQLNWNVHRWSRSRWKWPRLCRLSSRSDDQL